MEKRYEPHGGGNHRRLASEELNNNEQLEVAKHKFRQTVCEPSNAR
jgi:hypothetical protein